MPYYGPGGICDCEHEWRALTRDHMEEGKPGFTQVECVKCGVPGERTDDTGEVFWPAT